MWWRRDHAFGWLEKGPCFCWVLTVTNKPQLAQPHQRLWFSDGMGWHSVGAWQGGKGEAKKLFVQGRCLTQLSQP